jgi:hypothetical protein
LRKPAVTGVEETRVMVEALHSTLDVLNKSGLNIVLDIMERTFGVHCSVESCSPKEEIERALIQVLGQDAGRLIINEWNKKITRMQHNS